MNAGYSEGFVEGFLEQLVKDGHPGAQEVLQAFILVMADNKRNRRILADLKIKLAGMLE